MCVQYTVSCKQFLLYEQEIFQFPIGEIESGFRPPTTIGGWGGGGAGRGKKLSGNGVSQHAQGGGQEKPAFIDGVYVIKDRDQREKKP